MSTTLVSFLRAIADHPDDDAQRLIFADWLEERGDCRAEFLRLDCALHTMTGDEEQFAGMKAHWLALRSEMPPGWLIVLGRSGIENCELRFAVFCPEKWELLKPTQTGSVRFCEVCRKNVHYCGTIDEAREHTRQGSCVAVDAAVPRQPGDLTVHHLVVMGLMDFRDE